MELIPNTIALLIGLLIGKLTTSYYMAKKLRIIDEIIFKKHNIKPIKEVMNDIQSKRHP